MSFAGVWALIVTRDTPTSNVNAARTAVAGVLSWYVATVFQLPEAYWAVVSTLIVMQSTLGATLPLSVQRFAGTAVGAVVGAATSMVFPGSIPLFALDLWAVGLLGAALRMDRSAYRYAGATLAIVLIVPRSASPWLIALHRFCEVSIGIAVSLGVAALWPEHTAAVQRSNAFVGLAEAKAYTGLVPLKVSGDSQNHANKRDRSRGGTSAT